MVEETIDETAPAEDGRQGVGGRGKEAGVIAVVAAVVAIAIASGGVRVRPERTPHWGRRKKDRWNFATKRTRILYWSPPWSLRRIAIRRRKESRPKDAAGVAVLVAARRRRADRGPRGPARRRKNSDEPTADESLDLRDAMEEEPDF